METKVIATKFVRQDVPELETLKFSMVYLLREKLNKGDKLNRTEKNWLAEAVNRNAYFKRAVPLMGCSLLWSLFRNRMTPYRGFFHNLKDFTTHPIKVA